MRKHYSLSEYSDYKSGLGTVDEAVYNSLEIVHYFPKNRGLGNSMFDFIEFNNVPYSLLNCTVYYFKTTNNN